MAVYGHLGVKGLKYHSSLLFKCVVKLKSVFCKVYVKHFVRSKNVSHSDAPSDDVPVKTEMFCWH